MPLRNAKRGSQHHLFIPLEKRTESRILAALCRRYQFPFVQPLAARRDKRQLFFFLCVNQNS
jgi:hypothetical protein